MQNIYEYIKRPTKRRQELEYKRSWIDLHIKDFGYGGTNNLNINLSAKELKEYFQTHQGSYKKIKFNLDQPL